MENYILEKLLTLLRWECKIKSVENTEISRE